MKTNQEILFSSGLGFLEIKQSGIIARIIGGSHVKRGSKRDIQINASASLDPDVKVGDFTGMTFTWLCKKNEESFPRSPLSSIPVISPLGPKGNGGCFDTGIGKLNSNGRVVTIGTGDMKVDTSYTIKLVVSKATGREDSFEQRLEVVEGDPPQMSISCRINCALKVNPSSRIKVKSICVTPSKTCRLSLKYHWTLRMLVKGITDSWTDVQNLKDKFSTPLNSPDAVIRECVLDPNQTYQLTVQAEYTGIASGISSYIFKTNSPPKGGSCNISPASGIGINTTFHLSCKDWDDVDKPLNYQFYYVTEPGLTSVISYGQDEQIKTKLPVGKKEDAYFLTIKIRIIDSLSAFREKEFKIKVESIKSNVKSAVEVASKEVNDLLKTGDVKKATQLANAALETMSGTDAIDKQEKSKIIHDIIDQMTKNVKAGNLQTLTQITSVIGRATANPDDVTLNAQDETLQSLKDMIDLLVEKSVEESASEGYLVDASGENLALSLGNMMKSGSKKAKVREETPDAQQRKQSIKVTEDSVVLVNKVGESLLKRKVIGESPSVVRTASLSMVLGRQVPGNLQATKIEEGGTSFVLPSGNALDDALPTSKFIDSQMTFTEFNPFTWDTSANLVDTEVSSLVLRNEQGSEIPIQNLKQDIQISIPRSHPSNSTLAPEASFLKPKQIRNYKFIVDYPGKGLELQIESVQLSSVYLLVQHGKKPSESSNDFAALLSSLPGCSVIQIVKACRKENGGIFLSSLLLAKQGVYYVGILLKSSTHNRRKRSCFGHGRQKRSCVEPKDAPKPENITNIPSYDPKTDVNFSLSTQEYNCVYWDGSKWTNKGCKAGSNSSSGTLHCLCNHLTSFGGSFLIAPNPIDFDVVLLALSRLDESGNIAVLTTILIFLLLYLVVAVIARREDRRDARKFGPPLPINPSGIGRYHYEMTVITGIWRNSGTTANVVIEIQGSQSKSHAIILSRDMEPSRIMLASGNKDKFIIALPQPLGPIDYLNVWHDNSGSSPSWFLDHIIIKDIEKNTSWLFLYRDWFALEKGDGKISKLLFPTSPFIIQTFQHKFNYQTSKKLTEEHIWLSVVTKPPHSNFTRLQRATCCLSVLFSAMVVNAMFYDLDKTPEPGVQIGPLKFNPRQIIVGIYSSLIVVPVGLFIVFLFKNSLAKSAAKKHENRDKKNTICDYMCCYFGGSAKNKVYDKKEYLETSNQKSRNEAEIPEASDDNHAFESGLRDETATTSSIILRHAQSSDNDHNISICVSSENLRDKNQADEIRNNEYKMIEHGSKSDMSEIGILREDISSKTRETTVKHENEKDDCSSVNTVDTTILHVNEEQRLVQEDKVTSSSADKKSYTNFVSRFFFAKDDASKGRFWLPHCFIYISWVLCFVTVLISASFTFMYSLQWEKEIANRWLSSMLVSFTEDLFVVQPVKICITAIFLAIFFQGKNMKEESSGKPATKPAGKNEGSSKKDIAKGNMTFPEEGELQKAKDYQVKEEKMFSFVREAFLFGLFLTLLTIVCYGNRSYYGYEMTKMVKNEFSNFTKLSTSDKYWKWISTQYAQSAYAGKWYNNAPESNEMYTGNKMSILIGMPRIRQLRVKPDSCVIPKKARPITSTCYDSYSLNDEETSPLFLPGWIPFHNHKGLTWANLSQLCPKPWRYRTASDLPFWGNFHTYSGGGYIAELGYNNKTTHFVTSPLRSSKWIDPRTRALLLEMSIFNPNTNQLSAVTFCYEALPITFGHPFRVVETIALYGTESASYDFFLVCKLLFIFLVIYFLAREARKAFKMKQNYFKSFWNWFEIIKVLVAFSVVVCYVVKQKMLLTAVQHVKENPYLTVNFQSTLAWKNAEEASLSLVVFIATVNILRMLRFNPHIIIFSASLRSAREALLVYSVILSVVMISFALIGWLTLGTSMFQYHTILQALYSQLLMSLGARMHLNAMRNDFPILGPLIGFTYKVLMTFLFVNFYISVINDSYEQIKSTTDKNSKEFEMSDFILERLKEILFRKKYNVNTQKGEGSGITKPNETTPVAGRSSVTISDETSKQTHKNAGGKDRNVKIKAHVEECEFASDKATLEKLESKNSRGGHNSTRAKQNLHRMRRAIRRMKETDFEKTNKSETQSQTKIKNDKTQTHDLYHERLHQVFEEKCVEIIGHTDALLKDAKKEDIELVQLVLLFSKYFVQKTQLSEDVPEIEKELATYTPDWDSLSSEQNDEDESCETYQSDTEIIQDELWGSMSELLRGFTQRKKPIPDHLRFSNTLPRGSYNVSEIPTKQPPWRL